MEKTTGLILPTKKIKALSKSPRKLLIYSQPKIGKSSALAELSDSLLIDLERGTDFLDAVKVQATSIEDLVNIGKAIQEAGKPYKYIIIDTITKLEDMCMPLAIKNYQSSPMGKNYTGTNITTLPQGAGYAYIREAFQKVITYIETLAERIIYVGHLKLSAIELGGKEVQASGVDLLGKSRNMMCADMDANGILYRDGNKTILSFKTTPGDTTCGARPDHLRDKEIVLSEMDEKGKLTTHWNKIFID